MDGHSKTVAAPAGAEAETEVEPRPPPLEQLLAANARLSLSDIQHLQRWLSKQPHLPPMQDEELVPFLVSNGYSLERAKECVEKCMTMRTHAPELFSGRDPDDADNREQLQAFRVARLAERTPDGRRVLVLGYAPPDAFDAARFDGARSLRLSTALMELVTLDDAYHDCTVALVLDAQHVTLAHLARMPLPQLQRLMAFVQEAAPLRINAVHVVNLGSVGKRALELVRPFMGAQLLQMAHFHSGNMEDFYKEFPRDMLPVELGGTCGSIAEYHRRLVERLRRARRWLLAQERRVADEALRPPGAPAASAASAASARGSFGVDGSFRSLCID